MADRKNHHLFPVEVIQRDVRPPPEFDHPFAKLRRQLFDRAANLRMLAECFHALAESPDRALCCILAPGSQEFMEAGHIRQGLLGPL